MASKISESDVNRFSQYPFTETSQRMLRGLSAAEPLYARAPTRIDFAGGWTDLIPFASETEGAVLNAAIDLYVYAFLTPKAGDAVSLYSMDLHRQFCPPPQNASLRGLSLPEAILSWVRPQRGCHLITRSDAPKGGGLGVSGGMGITPYAST